ncbi:MAG TPA: hypothetical protein ENO22_01240 [candidate division Zixibacteria bacterium]|nr:hypothetical protein [candidate division Zixibacteria bacterium]
MPKAYPDFEETAERYLDGELTPDEKKRFLGRARKDEELSRMLKEMKLAKDSMRIYEDVLPGAAKFNSARKRILSAVS